MKKLFISILLIILLISTSGCGLFNLDGWVIPDDAEFLALIEELDTPEKICQYMLDNFKIEEHPYKSLTPYQLYLTQKGDCNDFSAFSTFIANYHGYETYQILIIFYPYVFGYSVGHTIGVFKEKDCYTISEGQFYLGRCQKTFMEIVNFNYQEDWASYTVYDYWNNIVEQITK